MTIGERIKEKRESLGFTQVDFADKIGVSKQTLYKYENNIVKNIPSDKIESIARICNTSPAYIMGWVTSGGDEILDYYNDSVDEISDLFRSEGYILHFENYSYEPLIIVEHTKTQCVFAFYEGDILCQYEKFKIDRQTFSAKELLDATLKSAQLYPEDEHKLLTNYRKLNDTGKAKAQEDIEDLTQIPKYTTDLSLIQAAHPRTDIEVPEGTDATDDGYFD